MKGQKEADALQDWLDKGQALLDALHLALQPVGVTVTGKGIIDGFNITSYATDPTHEDRMAKQAQFIFKKIGPDVEELEVDDYINVRAPTSPVTGKMVLDACNKYNVSVYLLLALIQNDSLFGTLGKGSHTHNPGNVGNDDEGHIKDWGTWQAGVDAVADWLNRHRV